MTCSGVVAIITVRVGFLFRFSVVGGVDPPNVLQKKRTIIHDKTWAFNLG